VAQSFVVAWPPISGGGTMLLAIWFIGPEPESGVPVDATDGRPLAHY
jgi:hypothetical protein